MRTYKKIEKEELDEIFCDCCGETTMDIPLSISHTFGYFSKQDGDKINLDICDHCLPKVLGKELMKKGLKNKILS